MNGAKIQEVVGLYRNYLKENGVEIADLPKGTLLKDDEMTAVIGVLRSYFEGKKVKASDFPHESKPSSKEEMLAHCHGMLNKMESFIKEGRREKNLRWLGFILGCLRAHSRSKREILIYCQITLDRIEHLVREECTDEAFLLLGFAQGCFWSIGQYSLEELTNHNRP